ncbi:hypothetical protein UT4_17830 [Ferrigenium sp. UT4]
MDDETVEGGRRIVRHAPETPQQHTGDKAKDEQDEVVHIRHSGAGRNPVRLSNMQLFRPASRRLFNDWIPACAGMTN